MICSTPLVSFWDGFARGLGAPCGNLGQTIRLTCLVASLKPTPLPLLPHLPRHTSVHLCGRSLARTMLLIKNKKKKKGIDLLTDHVILTHLCSTPTCGMLPPWTLPRPPLDRNLLTLKDLAPSGLEVPPKVRPSRHQWERNALPMLPQGS